MTKPETERVRGIRLERLESVFPDRDLATLSYRDYPRVKEELGWAESTFKSALDNLGCDSGDLENGLRTYLPSDTEIAALRRHVNRDLITTLAAVGCRFTELWSMRLSGQTLIIKPNKGGNRIILSLDQVSRHTRYAIRNWVETVSRELTPVAARKRWQRAIQRELVSPECVPHSFRHRLATLMDEAGASVYDIQYVLGHRNVNTTRAYRHKNLLARMENVLLPTEGRTP